MRNFFEKLNYKLQVWMQDRYGLDELSKKMVIVSVVCFLLSAFTRQTIIQCFGIITLIWVYFRCFSKNISARYNELNAYYNVQKKFRNKIDLRKRIWHDRKTYRYFKCKNCKAVLRVPKGKGKIEITCNVCKHKMKKKT